MHSNKKKNQGANNEVGQKKKSFNKKQWRELRYSGKAKVLRWESIKRKQALRQYRQELKRSGVTDIKEKENRDLDKESNFKGALQRAQLRYQKIQEEKEQRRKEKELDRKQREEAIRAYKEKKAIRNQKLFHKTRSGRVSMKGRLELMLEKIQKEYGQKEE